MHDTNMTVRTSTAMICCQGSVAGVPASCCSVLVSHRWGRNSSGRGKYLGYRCRAYCGMTNAVPAGMWMSPSCMGLSVMRPVPVDKIGHRRMLSLITWPAMYEHQAALGCGLVCKLHSAVYGQTGASSSIAYNTTVTSFMLQSRTSQHTVIWHAADDDATL